MAIVGGAPISTAAYYNPPQRFAIGLQTAADWNSTASFIGMASAPNTACPWLRVSFEVTAAQAAALAAGNASAQLHVASAGYHEAYVNGVRLENTSVLLPSVSYLSKRLLSHTYDAAPALVVGPNVLGLWLAPGEACVAKLLVL